MNAVSSLLLALSLSTDAFAAALCKGLAAKNVKLRHMLCTGAWFGSFQCAMPLAGFYSVSSLGLETGNAGRVLAAALLFVVGADMLYEALAGKTRPADASFSIKTMFVMSAATSLDALSAGGALALNADKNILLTSFSAGLITFVLSAAGVKAGNLCSDRHKQGAQFFGGAILELISIKLLFESP